MLSSRMSANSTDSRFVAGHHADEQKEQKAKNASKESKTYVCKEKLEADVKSLQFFMRPTFD